MLLSKMLAHVLEYILLLPTIYKHIKKEKIFSITILKLFKISILKFKTHILTPSAVVYI